MFTPLPSARTGLGNGQDPQSADHHMQEEARVCQELLPAFQLQVAHQLQDLLCSLLLCECVYKVVDYGPAAALAALTGHRDEFPTGTVNLSAAQFCRRRVSHRYMLGSGGGAMYVAFMGTKELRDFMVDAALVQQVLWEGNEAAGGAAAHGGFLSRAEGVPVESLYLHAQRQGLRLVLCGHSLGGAVATLVTLRLLSTLRHPPALVALSCICFGTPALGNEALAAHVEKRGWGRYFRSYALPEDPVPRLFLATKRSIEDKEALAGGSGGNVGQRSSWAEGKDGGAAASEAALAVLFREEAASGDVDAAELQSDDTNDADGGAAAERSRPGPLSLLSRWSPHWAHHTLRAVARTAGAVRLPAVPFLTAFSHFGSTMYLSPEGVAAEAPTAAVAPPATGVAPGAAPSAPDAATPQRGWMPMHRMFSYRRRVLDICHRTLRQRGIECDSSGGNAQPAVASTALAPALEVREAEGAMPVMWSPLLTPRPAAGATSTAPRSSEPAGFQAGFLQPTAAHRSGERGRLWRFGRPVSSVADAGATSSDLPARYSLTVGVRGQGLDMCSSALLRLPGGTVLKAAAATNLAKDRTIAALTAAQVVLDAGRGSEEGSGAGRLLRAVQDRLPRFRALPSNAAAASNLPGAGPADLELHFVAPTPALLQLTWQGARQPPGNASLVLLSDFSKVPVPVRLLPRAAWLLGPDPRLCQAVFSWLQASAAADAATAAAAAAAVGRPRWLPLGIAAGYGGWITASATAAAAASRGSLQQHDAASSNPAPTVAASWRARVPAGLHRLYAEHAVPWLQRVQRRLIGAVGGGTPSAGQGLPATLLRGVLLRDISSAVQGAGSGAGSLARAAALLQWKADQLAEGSGTQPEDSSGDDDLFKDFGWSPEEEEDLLAARKATGLGARVLSALWTIHHASVGVRRRTALLLRWRSIRSLPPPRVVALVVSVAALESAATGSGFDHAMLAAIQRTAAAAAALGAATLLAVMSSRPLDGSYRRKLSYSAGLHGRPGAVVPVLWQDEREEAVAASMLQAAILAHAAGGGRQKLAPSGRL